MCRPSCRLIILVLCVAFLFIQPEKVSGIRWEQSKSRFERNSRGLKAMKDLHTQTKEEYEEDPTPSTINADNAAIKPEQGSRAKQRRWVHYIHYPETKFGQFLLPRSVFVVDSFNN
nr:CLAVATA3/ESR (CLE)-related protein 45 [Ipomoea batatas]